MQLLTVSLSSCHTLWKEVTVHRPYLSRVALHFNQTCLPGVRLYSFVDEPSKSFLPNIFLHLFSHKLWSRSLWWQNLPGNLSLLLKLTVHRRSSGEALFPLLKSCHPWPQGANGPVEESPTRSRHVGATQKSRAKEKRAKDRTSTNRLKGTGEKRIWIKRKTRNKDVTETDREGNFKNNSSLNNIRCFKSSSKV